MASKKPPEGFDPDRPPEEGEPEDPHLERTSPYDVGTLVAALANTGDESSEKKRPKPFTDFGATERSVPFQPPADPGAPEGSAPRSPRPTDPRLFLDDTEVLHTKDRPVTSRPPVTEPPGRRRPAALDLPPPPVKTPTSGVLALPRPAGTNADEPRGAPSTDRDLTPEPITSSVERPVVVPTGAPSAPIEEPAPVDLEPMRHTEATGVVPAEVSLVGAEQEPRVPTQKYAGLASLEERGAIAAPPSDMAGLHEAETEVRPPTSVDEQALSSDLPTEDASGPATRLRAEPMSAPAAPEPPDEPTREMTADASLLVPPIAPPPPTRAAVPAAVELGDGAAEPRRAARAGVAILLFFVTAIVGAALTLALTGGDETTRGSDDRAAAGADQRDDSRAAIPDGDKGDKTADPDPDPEAEREDALATADREADSSDEAHDVDDDRALAAEAPVVDEPPARDEPEAAVRSASRGTRKARHARAAKRARKRAARGSRDVFVVGVRNGSGHRVPGLLSALRGGLGDRVRREPRLKMARGSPGDGALTLRLRLDELSETRTGATRRVTASCSLAAHDGPAGPARARVRAVGAAHGGTVTRALRLDAVRACGQQLGGELRSLSRAGR